MSTYSNWLRLATLAVWVALGAFAGIAPEGGSCAEVGCACRHNCACPCAEFPDGTICLEDCWQE